MDEQEVGRRVRDGIIGVIRGTGDVLTETVRSVSGVAKTAVGEAAGTAGAVGEVGVSAVRGAIRAVGDVGGDAAETAATSINAAVDAAASTV